MEDYNAIMAEYVQINAKIRELDARKDEIKTKMLVFAKTKQLKEYVSDTCRFYIMTQRRKSQDKEALNTYLVETSNGKTTLESFETINEIEVVRIDKLGVE
jgi:hypothetical protein